jgi:catechol 2,3-dioxygenase-like lactoylglutathione lyase family enzyme
MRRGATLHLFRVLLPAKSLAKSKRFYEALLGSRGRQVAGGRIYFDCGPVILGLLDYSSVAEKTRPHLTEVLYFATNDLEGIHRRAVKLGCLDRGLIHNDPANPAGEVVVRPWGERSFYAHDPSGNPLCFVATRTKFTGTPRQVAEFRRADAPRPRRRSSVTAPRSTPTPRTHRGA